jgi:tRNA 5-methylaminomethyl-2-thiouridine biosynthesis bifunctional protein
MRTEPIVPARIDFGRDDGVPWAPDFGDVYHPREGVAAQARGVFLQGNGLPGRWQGRERFTIVETGFGLGHNFLATWAAWRDDPSRCTRLHFVSFEKHPPRRDDLQRALARSPWPELGRQLVQAWPPLTPNLHEIDFDDGRVRLLLGLGDATALARATVARADAFYLDGFAPACNAALWTPDLFRALARLAAPGATVATWSAARAVRDGLAGAGFDVQAAPGPGRKRDITLARHAPRFVPEPPPGRRMPEAAPTHAVVVGAGLAGAASARALAREGIDCTVLDRAPAPAAGASGNPAGLFHGTVGVDDGPHMRWHRAASVVAAAWVRDAATRGVPGAADGLLRLDAAVALDAMQAVAQAQGLPPDYVEVLDATAASARAGLPLGHPGWRYTHGGWVDPAALVSDALAQPGVRWKGQAHAQALRRSPEGWQVLDGQGKPLAEAPMVVLASGDGTLGLAGLPAAWARRQRGQVSWVGAADVAVPLPRCPVASGHYLLALPGSGLLFGATQQADDDDATVRDDDHAANLAGAAALVGGRNLLRDGASIDGRVGWRVVTRDRLPMAGRAPDLLAPMPARRDAPRLVPRREGLYLLCALGSRGITSAGLAARLVAAQASGAPWPVEADLADALDPARFALR